MTSRERKGKIGEGGERPEKYLKEGGSGKANRESMTGSTGRKTKQGRQAQIKTGKGVKRQEVNKQEMERNTVIRKSRKTGKATEEGKQKQWEQQGKDRHRNNRETKGRGEIKG